MIAKKGQHITKIFSTKNQNAIIKKGLKFFSLSSATAICFVDGSALCALLSGSGGGGRLACSLRLKNMRNE